MRVDLIVKNIGEIVTPVSSKEPLGGELQGKLTTIKEGLIAVKDGKIVALGPEKELLTQLEISPQTEVIDAQERAVIPGFVDPHTHLVYAGCRHEEFLWKLQGKDYIEILEQGGGILSTVNRTRKIPEEKLFEISKERALEAFRMGTTTIEIKSGYGLDEKTELKMLKVIKKIDEETPLDVVSTYLGAHAIPPEFKEKREKYIELIKEEMLSKVKGLAQFVDVFCDKGAFSYGESKEILHRAKNLGFSLKIHADELSNSGGSKLAGELGAISADHLENIDSEGIDYMKRAGVIAVLLPGTSFFLKLKSHAPARRLIEAGIPIALATDHNPGTSPILSQAIIMGLGIFLLNLLPEEALVAVTKNAAHAIGLGDRLGSLEPGKQADFLILNTHSFVHIPYEFGRDLVEIVVKKGKVYRVR